MKTRVYGEGEGIGREQRCGYGCRAWTRCGVKMFWLRYIISTICVLRGKGEGVVMAQSLSVVQSVAVDTGHRVRDGVLMNTASKSFDVGSEHEVYEDLVYQPDRMQRMRTWCGRT